MNDQDVEQQLRDLFGTAPVISSPARLQLAVAGDVTGPAPRGAVGWHRPRGRAIYGLAGLAATLVLAAGLLTVVANRPAPAATPSLTPTASPTASPTATPSLTPTATPAASPTETPEALPTDTPAATPASTTDPLPSVGAAPSGTWRSIRWTALPAIPKFGATSSPAAGATFQVFGWSRGYVGFTTTPADPPETVDPVTGYITYLDPTVVSSYSSDGVHWHAGQKLNLAAAGSHGPFQVMRTVIEGPAGLLAVGWTGGCGSEYLDSLYTSADGRTWQPVNAGKALGVDPTAIADVSGGGAGFVAVGFKGSGVWTSKDGRSWQRVPLNSAPFANSIVDDGTAISGGFVLAGTAGVMDCNVPVLQDGQTPPPPVFRTATVWWSVDRSNWTRISLSGATASSESQNTWVGRLGDQSLIAVNDISSPSGPSVRSAWTSKDGRIWTPVPLPDNISQPDIISGGQHNLVVEPAMGTDDNGYPVIVGGKLGLRTFDDTFALVTVAQSGDLPRLVYTNSFPFAYGMVAIGPTGVVVTNADGSQLWFGTPSTQ